MRTNHLLLIGALVALAAIGVVAAQSTTDSGSDSASDSGTDSPLAGDHVLHDGKNCPKHDVASSGSGSSSDEVSAAA